MKYVRQLVVKDTKFEGQENSGTALELIETTAQIVNSTFVSNIKGSYRLFAILAPWYVGTFRGFVGGAIIATNSTNINISQSRFENNRADNGGAIFADSSIINMTGNVSFINNTANGYGGALYSKGSVITTINASMFISNLADRGGALWSFKSSLIIEASGFHDNTASNGGVLYSVSSIVRVIASEFDSNRAVNFGGALSVRGSTVTIEGSEFNGNSANYSGGVLSSTYNNNTITIVGSVFGGNRANRSGGVLYSDSSNITIGDCIFKNNSSPVGAVLYTAYGCNIHYHNYLLMDRNSANNYAVVHLSDSELNSDHTGNATFSNNLGSLVAFSSNVTFRGYSVFVNNQPPNTTTGTFREGGAITLLQSNVFFDGECNLEHNHAKNGGAIHSIDSKLNVNGDVTTAHNTATASGGGVYLSTSELNCQQKSTFVFYSNAAMFKGGGLHAISSLINASSNLRHLYHIDDQYLDYTGTRLNFTNNEAKFGGGLSLEANAKLIYRKYDAIPYGVEYFDANTTLFTGNSADYGGAVYVDDATISGTCASDPKTECFFQVLALYDYSETNSIATKCIHFSQNYANISGSTLYGGLLDRCAVSLFAEYYVHDDEYYRGGRIAYFRKVSDATNISISSAPVQVHLCTNSIQGFTYQSKVYVKKGETFKVLLVAVDQVGQPVSATIQASLGFTESGLAEGQLARNVPAMCTNLSFNVVSPHDHQSEILVLYASDGPCRNVELSRAIVKIHFLPCSCPIGLQIFGTNRTNCTCQCHSDISQYVKQCDTHTGSLVKRPQSRAWISYINDAYISGYVVYPNCPFDYCLSTSPPVDLNQPNGADAQCAFNRSSLLCGSCRSGLSLSLGSSCCLPCPSYWPAILIAITIAAILAGIILVTVLLVLNMTVAVGTLNELIFYANVVYANRSILLPFQDANFVTVVISWLNLDLGIDTCYFPGMNTYFKTWLQLAFPAYVIILVVLVIIISSHSNKFSNLIGKKDPVATLATLVLLSYTKFLEVCFKILSVGVLEYPDGSRKMVWLPDATVRYLSVKHILLFIVAVVILLVGLVYTALLFSWQWLLNLPNWRILKWSRNPKIQTFIETYHTPYIPKHRYWTGLLLIVRVVLYLVAAANVSNDPTVALTAITSVVCCIALLKGFVANQLYRKRLMDVLETLFRLNILFFTIFTWYALGNERFHQEIIARTSVIFTIVLLLLIILGHMYTYTNLFSKVKKSKLGGLLDKLFTQDMDPNPKPRVRRLSTPPDDDIHRFGELLDELDCPVNTDDYNTIPLLVKPPVEPTFSVVELPKPHDLKPPDPE